jgi:hypothetical protein
MADGTYGPKFYREQGGDRAVVASGGSLDVESGGEIDIESGGALKIGGTALTTSAAELNTLHTPAAYADGLVIRVAQFTFDPSLTAGMRTVGAHGLGVSLPAKAIILDGVIDVITTFQSAGADAGTIALHVEGAGDIVVGIAIADGGNPWDAGLHMVVPVVSVATMVKTTVAREITATVALQALTAGKLHGFLRYVVSE